MIGLELCKSNQAPEEMRFILIAFMPLPGGWAIIYEDAFVNKADIQLEDIFAGRLIRIDVVDTLRLQRMCSRLKMMWWFVQSSNITTVIQKQVGCDVVGVDLRTLKN